jgi:lipid A biosynthesis lauroyl/palmitoleoyl acyltransferase
MSDTAPFPIRQFLGPRYWPTWLILGILRLSVLLPYPSLIRLGTGLGWLGYYLMPKRRQITRINIEKAFPELDKKTQHRMVRECFYSATVAIFESALAWWAPDKKVKSLLQMEGLENIDAARQQHKGVLVLGGHYTTLEIAGRLITYALQDFHLTYKPAHDRLFEAIMSRARRRYSAGLLPSSDLRSILHELRKGHVVWIAPDQDFGGRHSVFAPFMGIPTSTLTVMSRLAARAGCQVVPAYHERLPGNQGYRVAFGAALNNFASGNDVLDATQVNQAIEVQVRRTPVQYLWGHRRFRTRPRGEPQFYPARRDKNLRRYSRLLGLLSLPAVFYTAWTAWRNHSGQYLWERLGLGGYPVGPFDIWLHAASVGEVNAVMPLIHLLDKRHPNLKLLLTVNTPSGHATACRILPPQIPCHYLPVDWQFAVRRFLDHIQPRTSLVVETELWPNLYLQAHYRGAPITIINGRISKRTSEAPMHIRLIYYRTLESVYAILARSIQDAEHFRALAFNPDYLSVVGNLKFAAASLTAADPFPSDRPYILAASTRPGEEKHIVECWKELDFPDHLLIIVPRHPKRRSRILKDIAGYDLKIAIRSRGEPLQADTQLYLADTFGELTAFIAGSAFVIMGGSFEPFGGQNILEVARNGKAVIFGPHMANFQDEANIFLEREAGLQVSDTTKLCAAITRLISEPELAEQMGQNGLQLMQEMSDMAERYLDQLESLLPVFNSGSA